MKDTTLNCTTDTTSTGKNVWALTVESERPDRQSHEFTSPEVMPRPPTLRPAVEKAPTPAVQIPVSFCRHKKLRQACHFCESAPGTPTAPPKKKHCRSLSVPPDSGFGNQGYIPPDLDPLARLWKPIAMIPLSNTSSSGGGGSIISPCEPSKGRLSSTSSNLSPIHPAMYESGGRGSSWLPKLPGSNLQLLPSASAASSDSGHFTISDFQTPPGSPVPTAATRPASASSDTASSFSSMSSAWLDFTSGGGGSNNSSSGGRAFHRARTLQNRSLSCEDRISGSFSSSSPYTSAAAASTISMPCVHAGVLGTMETCCPNSSLSGASRCRSGSQDGSSDGPTLACTGSIPRCHSQPCVLHHRRCGKKRRRNCDRPTLNFNKMTEVSAKTLLSRRVYRRSAVPSPTQSYAQGKNMGILKGILSKATLVRTGTTSMSY